MHLPKLAHRIELPSQIQAPAPAGEEQVILDLSLQILFLWQSVHTNRKLEFGRFREAPENNNFLKKGKTKTKKEVVF